MFTGWHTLSALILMLFFLFDYFQFTSVKLECEGDSSVSSLSYLQFPLYQWMQLQTFFVVVVVPEPMQWSHYRIRSVFSAALSENQNYPVLVCNLEIFCSYYVLYCTVLMIKSDSLEFSITLTFYSSHFFWKNHCKHWLVVAARTWGIATSLFHITLNSNQ